MTNHSRNPGRSKVDEFLASLDLERARTPDELAAVGAEIRRVFAGSQELRKLSRPPRGLWKKYLEEVLPLTDLARHLFRGRQEVLCQPNLRDSENYDAVITLSDGGMTSRLFVEFTCAKDGFEDSLRMEVLNDLGHVNMLGQVTYSGTKNTGHQIEVENETVTRSRTLEKHRRLIVDRLKAKSGKKYGVDHVLGVVFDDWVGFRSDEEMAALKSYLESAIDLSALDFKSVYLLGSFGEILSELPLQR